MKFSISYLGQKIKKQAQNSNAPVRNASHSDAGGPATIAEYNREVLVKLGADQFKKLIDKGINIPVALL